MKFSSLTLPPPPEARAKKRGFNPNEAAIYIGSDQAVDDLVSAGWLKPFLQRNRCTRYDVQDLDACIERMKLGEKLPSAHGANG